MLSHIRNFVGVLVIAGALALLAHISVAATMQLVGVDIGTAQAAAK